MCREKRILGIILISLGAGVLLSCLFGSILFQILVGVALVILGLLLSQH